MGSNADDVTLVRRALDGDVAAGRCLVRRITPTLRHRVCRTLAGFCRARHFDRCEVHDLTQQLLLLLFDNRGAVLSSWDPVRGLSLENFVGLVAEREVRAILGSGKRSAWAETPTAEDVLEARPGDGANEHLISVRDEIRRIWCHLDAELGPRDRALFWALLVDQRSVTEVCRAFRLSETAVYNFRSRLRRKLRDLACRLDTPARAPCSKSPELTNRIPSIDAG